MLPHSRGALVAQAFGAVDRHGAPQLHDPSDIMTRPSSMLNMLAAVGPAASLRWMDNTGHEAFSTTLGDLDADELQVYVLLSCCARRWDISACVYGLCVHIPSSPQGFGTAGAAAAGNGTRQPRASCRSAASRVPRPACVSTRAGTSRGGGPGCWGTGRRRGGARWGCRRAGGCAAAGGAFAVIAIPHLYEF